MIRKWLKILPYFLVMKLVRNSIAPQGNLYTGYNSSETNYKIRYCQIDEGEFVVFSEDLQDIFNKRRREQKKQKLEIKKDKFMKKLDKDYNLKEEIKKEFKEEMEEELESGE